MAVRAQALAGRAGADRAPSTMLQRVSLPALMDITAGAPNVAVALIDGPVAQDHPDLANNNIQVLPVTDAPGCSRPASPACAHGTAVAGVLHARRGGPAPGICPECPLLVRSIFSEDAILAANDGMPGASGPQLADALLEAVDAGARVINLSVGLTEAFSRADTAIDHALARAANRGVVVVAAAGNQGILGSSIITRHPWVIPVTACDRHGRVSAQSNIGASIGRRGLAAPGDEVTTLKPSGGYATFSGSSAAAPFVSGTVALLWAMFPAANAAQLRSAILGEPYRRRSVVPPLLNAWAAYQTLRNKPESGRG
jgi:subtilisin family serine protease